MSGIFPSLSSLSEGGGVYFSSGSQKFCLFVMFVSPRSSAAATLSLIDLWVFCPLGVLSAVFSLVDSCHGGGVPAGVDVGSLSGSDLSLSVRGAELFLFCL